MSRTRQLPLWQTHLLFVGTAGSGEQQVVEIERGVAAVAGLAEGVRAIRVSGDRAVGAAEVRRHHLLGRRERWQQQSRRGRMPLNSVSPSSSRSAFEIELGFAL